MMADVSVKQTESKVVVQEGRKFISFILQELKPKGKILTPFNIISGFIIFLGLIIIIIRFAKGLGSVTNLSQEFPWGLWIGFDVITGVAFAGGAYVLTFAVYILKAEKYHLIIRATVLNGFLAYVFYAGALLLDIGRPWNGFNVIIGNDFGTNSVLFVVAWHFMLYTLMEFIEFSPAVAEWLGAPRLRKILSSLGLGAVIFGFTLSTLHQAGLGALYLLAKSKIHPLWYNEFIPVLFFVSSIFAGLSIVIIEGTISHRVFKDQISPEHHAQYDEIVIGLGKGAAVAMFAYLFLQAIPFISGRRYEYIDSPMGYWYLLEIIGFVCVPLALFVEGVRNKKISFIRFAAIMTAIGIIINRLNVSIIAYKWDVPNHYYPSWMEIEVTLAIVFAEIWAFRWVCNRMPVFRDPPDWAKDND
ncbi:NrfD/PsrC family molybdoenzyme membrane anchor subunit [candidate division CSSED10-310 bacterium]|uniref:NrfD/PsrC family molybdoenzyme membrane anchor subunit n=1 Tax=candidate division CSSED10-310 bacterium TaxID=2855610 RepID=A0ABV6Z6L4_UNCC1